MALEQNLSDRNNVYLDINIASLDSGVKQSRQGAICIKQATSERAGAMRAQQVLDLNCMQVGHQIIAVVCLFSAIDNRKF